MANAGETERGVDPSRRPSWLEPQYELIDDAPPPMPWEKYAERVRREWQALLSSPEAKNESELQSFIEDHPSMLMSVGGTIGRLTPWPYAVISQPPLSGLTTNVPDFLWITFNSAILQPVLIEIETPTKRWFNQKNVPSKEFVQAQDQLATWRAWFEEEINRQWFLEYYEIPDDIRRGKKLEPVFALVIGRRSEFEGNRALNLKRSSMERDGEILATFDRLEPDAMASSVICARKNDSGYMAISVPASVTLSPSRAVWLSKIGGKPEAAAENDWVTPERRRFLVERFPYWDERAEADALRYVSGEGE
jgi:hypothetical protein